MHMLPDTVAVPTVASSLDGANATALTVTINPDDDEYVVLDVVSWSYNGTPTGGELSLAVDGTDTYKVDITEGGPGHLPFGERGMLTSQTKGLTVVVTLAAVAGVGGQLNVLYR